MGHADTMVIKARELYAYATGCLDMNPRLFEPEEELA